MPSYDNRLIIEEFDNNGEKSYHVFLNDQDIILGGNALDVAMLIKSFLEKN